MGQKDQDRTTLKTPPPRPLPPPGPMRRSAVSVAGEPTRSPTKRAALAVVERSSDLVVMLDPEGLVRSS